MRERLSGCSGRLFIAGVVPGIILTVIYALGIWFMAQRSPQLILTRGVVAESGAPQSGIGLFPFLKFLSTCWGVVVLIGVTLGGIWLGSGEFQRITWEEALDFTVSELNRIKKNMAILQS